MIETHTILDLTHAIEYLNDAKIKTVNGFVKEECCGAIQTIQCLIKCLVDSE